MRQSVHTTRLQRRRWREVRDEAAQRAAGKDRRDRVRAGDRAHQRHIRRGRAAQCAHLSRELPLVSHRLSAPLVHHHQLRKSISYLPFFLQLISIINMFITFPFKNVKRASEYIYNENERLFIPKGLLMIDPMERGLRCVRDEFNNSVVKRYKKFPSFIYSPILLDSQLWANYEPYFNLCFSKFSYVILFRNK